MDNSEASIHYFGCWLPSHLWRMGNELNSSQAARKWRVCGVKTIHTQLTPSQNHAFQPDVFPCHYHFLKLNKHNITNATSSSTKTRVYVCSTITISHVDRVEANTRSGITRAPTGARPWWWQRTRKYEATVCLLMLVVSSGCRIVSMVSTWCTHTAGTTSSAYADTPHTLCASIERRGRDGGVSQ